MEMAKTTRKYFNDTFHFKDVAEDKARCCRCCADFRRHPSGVTFCHYLFHILFDQNDSQVWGKCGCDRFSLPVVEETK